MVAHHSIAITMPRGPVYHSDKQVEELDTPLSCHEEVVPRYDLSSKIDLYLGLTLKY